MVTFKEEKKRFITNLFNRYSSSTFVKVIDEDSKKVMGKYESICKKNEKFFIGKIHNNCFDICSLKTGKILFRFNFHPFYIEFISKNYVLIEKNDEKVLINLSECKDYIEISSISDLLNTEGIMCLNNYFYINDDLCIFFTKKGEFLFFDKKLEDFTKTYFDGTIDNKTRMYCTITCDNFIVLNLYNDLFNVIELNQKKFMFKQFIEGNVREVKKYNDKLFFITNDYSLIDETGRVTIDGKFYIGLYFVSDKPFVILENKNYRYGLAKVTGEIIFEAKYREVIELPDKFVVEEFPTKEYTITEYNI